MKNKIKGKSKPKRGLSIPTKIILRADHRGMKKVLPFIFAGIIALITLVVFSPSFRCGFTNWDDPVYVTKQELLLHPGVHNLKDIFTTNVSNNYHPLTMLSLKWDTDTALLSPKPFHVTNVILHIINTLLVFVFIYLLGKKRIWVAVFVAFFFGIHPMHVESVSWISERKDVLYTMFFLMAAISYLKYIFVDKKKSLWYILTLFFFVLSCLSKAMAVSLTLILLLLDFYCERKITFKVVMEKIPFLILSLLFGVVAIKAQAAESIAPFAVLTLFQRVMIGTYSMLIYLVKLVIPYQLSAFYPYPSLLADGTLPKIYYASPFIALAITGIVVWSLKYKKKIFFFGFFFFLTTIILVLQFVSVGQVIIAERYSYVPYIGLLFMIGEVYNNYAGSLSGKGLIQILKIIIPASVVIAGCIFCYITYNRAQVWNDNESLWTDVIKKHPGVAVAYKNRGLHYVDNKEYDKALQDYNNFIAIKQDDGTVYSQRANMYGLQHKYDLALKDYSKAIELEKGQRYEPYLNRAITYSLMKEYSKAIADYDKAMSIAPDSLIVYQNRGYLLIETNNFAQALENFNKLISLNKQDYNAFYFRGFAKYKLGKMKEAIEDYNASIALNPGDGKAWLNRAFCYRDMGERDKAMEDALQAKRKGADADALIKSLSR